jgi:hypothetical protein
MARHLLLAALAVSSLLALTAGFASANRLSVDDRTFRFNWTALRFTGPTGSLTCPVTLASSFHSNTIVKTAGLLIGYITAARVEDPRCAGGRFTMLTATLPWHVRYASFTGALPRIATATLTFIGVAFRFSIGGAEPFCLVGTTAAEPARGIISLNAAGQATSIAWEGSIDLTPSPDTLCDFLGANAEFSGAGSVSDGAGNLSFIRLI